MLFTMKLLVVTILSSIVQAQGCDNFFDACSDVHDVATISCDAALATDCTIANGSLQPDETLDYLLDPAIQTIDVDLCRKKCKEHAETESEEENKCKFFIWELGHAGKQTTCSLQTKCDGPSQYCNNFDCVSGQLGCDDEGNEFIPCKLTAKTEWGHDKFHVICTDRVGGDVNIYNDDIANQDIADDTICSTIRKCAAWSDVQLETEFYYRKLGVYCDGTDGKWKAVPDSGSVTESEAMIAGVTTIVEPECTSACEPLTLTTYATQWWADLICDTPLANGDTLVEGNSCILLCDNHLKMSIDCEFTKDGEKLWQDHTGKVLGDADVKC